MPVHDHKVNSRFRVFFFTATPTGRCKPPVKFFFGELEDDATGISAAAGLIRAEGEKGSSNLVLLISEYRDAVPPFYRQRVS